MSFRIRISHAPTKRMAGAVLVIGNQNWIHWACVEGRVHGLVLAPAVAEPSDWPGPSAAADLRLRGAVARHMELVWRILRRSGLRPADAEDATQDAFWVLARRLDTVPERAERAFLIATALRIAADRRFSKWQRSVDGALDEEDYTTECLSPDEALDLRRAKSLLDTALESLDATDRAVFILAELEEMTRTEVARSLNLPEGSVASRLRRARESVAGAVRRYRAKPMRRA